MRSASKVHMCKNRTEWCNMLTAVSKRTDNVAWRIRLRQVRDVHRYVALQRILVKFAADGTDLVLYCPVNCGLDIGELR